MRQSNVIFGTIVFAFVIYITLRGQLPAYMALFSGSSSPAPSSDSAREQSPSANPNVKAGDIFSTEYFSNMGLFDPKYFPSIGGQ